VIAAERVRGTVSAKGRGVLAFPAMRGLPDLHDARVQVGVKEGVVLLTYSSLISAADTGASRIQQLVDWCGRDFDGLVVFDGAHSPYVHFLKRAC
jgi:hypothetical protein